MIDPSDLNQNDIEDENLPALVKGYLENGANNDDWCELLQAVRELGYEKRTDEDERPTVGPF